MTWKCFNVPDWSFVLENIILRYLKQQRIFLHIRDMARYIFRNMYRINCLLVPRLKKIQLFLDNEDAYDFTWNTTAFKLQSSETPLSTSQCQQRCQEVLQGYGAVFMVTSSEDLVVIEHALNHTKDQTQKYYVTFNITDHTFPRHFRSPGEGEIWAR